MDKHVIEALGRARVVIENGKVTEVGEPMITYCPLFKKYRGIERITREKVRENVEFRIESFGMCTPQRETRMRDFLSFGISEIIAMAVARNLLDCAVLVCDGAGTAVIDDPEIIQGIGGRLSAVIETTPYPEIISVLGEKRVLDPKTGRIDQFGGVSLAERLGFQRIGVTIVSADEATRIRNRYGTKVAIFAVHTTGVSEDDAVALFDSCDLVTACASKWVREVAKERAIFSVGNKIPVYAATEFGKMLMEERLKMIPHKRNESEAPDDTPRPLV
ncbi:MAG: DUF2099 family protein [Methanomassiliicoccales archaeon]|jgi:putative methanogenesis marker protein 8|nr:DUF2099 family protein [Methanomassiliicoccales archaeon]